MDDCEIGNMFLVSDLKFSIKNQPHPSTHSAALFPDQYLKLKALKQAAQTADFVAKALGGGANAPGQAEPLFLLGNVGMTHLQQPARQRSAFQPTMKLALTEHNPVCSRPCLHTAMTAL